jgi:hypothetical protein
MPRLREIRAYETPLTASKEKDWLFHLSAHHVRELLLHFMPSDFILDGSSMVSVICGKKPDHESQWYQVLGVTIYYVEGFDVLGYMAMSPEEKQERMLSELTAVLVHIAKAVGADPMAIEHAASCVRECNFSLRIPVRKLWRSSPDKQFRIEIYRCLAVLIGEVWEADILDKSHALLGVEFLTPRQNLVDRRTHFCKSRWEGEVYQLIYTYVDRVVYSLDLAKYKNR